MKIYLYVGGSRYSSHVFADMNDAVRVASFLLSNGIEACLVYLGLPVVGLPPKADPIKA
jgi:hypothetical protein